MKMSEMETLKRTNPEQYNAYQMIANTHNSFFLTGKAGTGKTTFLKEIQKEVSKNFLLLAPTGLAAINLGGQTIHSFFGFKFESKSFWISMGCAVFVLLLLAALTAFGVNIAVNAAINSKKNVALFNLEMSAEQLAMRMIAAQGGIEQNKLKTGRLEHNDWKKVNEAISELSQINLFIEDASGTTISEIRAKCRKMKLEKIVDQMKEKNNE